MWRPIRTQTVPSHAVYGYSLNQVDGSRFPSDPSQYANYTFTGYDSLYEAFADVSVDESTDILTLDFLPKKKSGSWDTFNRCEHYKRTVSVVDGDFAFSSLESGVKWRNFKIPILSFWDENYCQLSIGPSSAFGSADIPILGLPGIWGGLDSGVYKDDQGLFGLACERILPGIRPATSLLNSIYELKDVKTIPHTLANIQKLLTALENLVKGDIKYILNDRNRRGLKTLKTLLNAGADSYLQGNFNIAPLLQDITNVVFSVRAVESKLKQLAAHAKQPQRAHWGANLTGFNPKDETINTHGRPAFEDSVVSFRRIVTCTARFQATVEYSYEIPAGSYKESLVNGVYDYNGLVISPQVIWNGIPWTFVIDWLVSIGPWLGQFTGRRLEIVTHISQSGWSVKVDRNIALSANLTGPVAQVYEGSYYRTPEAVPLISSIRSSGLNSKEFSLASALGYSTFKH